MAVHQLSLTDARRIAVRAQLLDAPRPTDLFAVVRQLTLLQIDPTAAVAPNAHLVAWSRLGSVYEPEQLGGAGGGSDPVRVRRHDPAHRGPAAVLPASLDQLVPIRAATQLGGRQ